MELKSKFGKYKVKDVDSYIAQITANHALKTDNLERAIAELTQKNEELQKQVDGYREREGMISKVMLEANVRAKAIEDDYRHRADESDKACKQLHDEWVGGMQSASANLAKLRAEAKKTLDEIDGQFATLCSWADTRLESLENTSLPLSVSDGSLQADIASGANADLEELCKEMGFSEQFEAAQEAAENVQTEESFQADNADSDNGETAEEATEETAEETAEETTEETTEENTFENADGNNSEA